MNRSKQIFLFFSIIGVFELVAIYVGYQFLDPFNRDIIIATIPFDLAFYLVSTFFFVIFNRIFHGMGGLGFVESKLVKAKDIDVSFSEILGIDEAVAEAQEVVQLVQDRIKASGKTGKRIIRGLLLLGPPGCGKTLIAKAIATEAGLPFLALSGSDFVEKWHSLGAARIRGLFKEARRLVEQKSACVVFIDEIDVIGRIRDFMANAGEQETNRTLTQLLVEMDGLNIEEAGNIIVIGATNASEQVLDKALLRPGRFDRKIYIDSPDAQGREKLFKHYLTRVKSESKIDVKPLAKITAGKSPADIENIVRESALIAAKVGRKKVSSEDLLEALEKIDLGLRANLIISPKGQEHMAYHEAGHLLAVKFFRPDQDILKVSIAPRRRKFSVVQQVPKEEMNIRNQDIFMAQIKVHLGGYVAEKIVFEKTSELVRDDFDDAMSIARDMVWIYGMGISGFVGNYLAIDRQDISDKFKQHLNNDSEMILSQCMQSTEEMLRRKRGLLDLVANKLLERQELDHIDIDDIFINQS